MTTKLEPEVRAHLIGSIRRFFAEELDQDIGDLKADLVLDFFAAEIGPSVYNQGIADAQSFVADKLADMGNVRYEPEFDFWKKR